jgi:hypothetical protein
VVLIKADCDKVEFTVKPFFAFNTKTGKTEKHVISPDSYDEILMQDLEAESHLAEDNWKIQLI